MTDRTTTSRFFHFLFTLGSRPTWELIGVFCLGVLFLSVASNWIYDIAQDSGDLLTSRSLRVLLTLAVMLGLAFWLYQRYRHKLMEHLIKATFTESATVLPHRGLIWMLSPGSVDHPCFAIAHHYGHEEPYTLEHCWLVMTKGDQRIAEAKEALEQRLQDLGMAVQLHPVEVPRPDVESTYRAVDGIYRTGLADKGLEPELVIADITGGLKPMTTGMVLACLLRDLDLEYVETDRDELGQPINGTQRVVIVDVDFFPGSTPELGGKVVS
jgi:hypothetical protein